MPPLPEFATFAAVGAVAQLIDGALGMAYGVASAAMLLGLGLPPVVASASVHYAETFTCSASGLSHLAAGNVRRRLFWSLAIPGMIGAVIGACLVSRIPVAWMRLALTPYLIGIGLLLLLLRGLRGGSRHDENKVPQLAPPLGLFAGFADAMSGGGWSALTVTTLVARGATPRTVIGTVHLAKAVVSAAASVSFLLLVGASASSAVLGLIVGGVLAAPFGALLARRLPPRVAILLAATAVLGLAWTTWCRLFIESIAHPRTRTSRCAVLRSPVQRAALTAATPAGTSPNQGVHAHRHRSSLQWTDEQIPSPSDRSPRLGPATAGHEPSQISARLLAKAPAADPQRVP